MLATYVRSNDETLRLSLLAGDGTEIVSLNVDTSELQDNFFYGFNSPLLLSLLVKDIRSSSDLQMENLAMQ